MARKIEVDPETVTADFARRWWKALMANAVALVEDAAHDSSSRNSGVNSSSAQEVHPGDRTDAVASSTN